MKQKPSQPLYLVCYKNRRKTQWLYRSFDYGQEIEAEELRRRKHGFIRLIELVHCPLTNTYGQKKRGKRIDCLDVVLPGDITEPLAPSVAESKEILSSLLDDL